MHQGRITLGLSAESLALLDSAATRRMRDSRPISRQEWMLRTPEGRQAFQAITANSEFRSWPVERINDMLQKKYLAATGGVNAGRPPISQYRAAVIEDLITKYLTATE